MIACLILCTPRGPFLLPFSFGLLSFCAFLQHERFLAESGSLNPYVAQVLLIGAPLPELLRLDDDALVARFAWVPARFLVLWRGLSAALTAAIWLTLRPARLSFRPRLCSPQTQWRSDLCRPVTLP